MGFLEVSRSLIQQNTAFLGGGGIQNGVADQTDDLPTTTIVNSTITGNTAIGFSEGEDPTGYGGGVLNLAGTVNIEQSTIYGNSASVDGGGVANQGFDPEVDEDSGEPTVLSGNATMIIRSSIIVGNTVPGDMGPEPNDVGNIGIIEGDASADPPTDDMPFAAQIISEGYNVFGVVFPGVADPVLDTVNVDPTSVFIDDPGQMNPVAWLHDFGGVLPVFMPDFNKSGGLIAIDGGDPDPLNVIGPYDQRGFQFTRVSTIFAPIMDSGAAELQVGNFVVDTLVDETDGRFGNVPVEQGFFPINFISFFPDFSLREALDFNRKNLDSGLPVFGTITFSDELTDPFLNPDPTANTAAPTILLSSQLLVNSPVFIQGPAGFELEIDANDPTPGNNNADGRRIFFVDDSDPFGTIDVTINDLTLLGGDVLDSGGAIFNRENLTVGNSTIKENSASNDGGGIFTQLGTLLVENSTLNDNFAADDGGGIFVDTGLPPTVITANVRNSTISGNVAADKGGGVYNANGELLIEFSTITLNIAASTDGAGVASLPGPDALTRVHSSIISENAGGDIEFLLGASNIQSLGFNLIGDGNAAVVFNQPGDQTGVLDPMLAPLTQTGGPTPTHRLLPGSPAIDMGDSTAVAGVGNVPEFDQRGSLFTRVFDGLQDTKDRIDIGAYELQSNTFIVDSPIDENDGDTTLGNFSLREAIEASNANPLPDTIMFSNSLLFATILQTPMNDPLSMLQAGTPTDMRITDSVDIIGLGQSFLTLDGSIAVVDASGGIPGRARFFTIDDGDGANDIEVAISGLRLQNNSNTTDVGGSIKSVENLTLQQVTFISNSTFDDGINPGAVFNGGALYQRYGSLTLDNVTLTGNSTNGVDADGGAVYVRDADLTVLNNTTISGNSTTQTQGSGGGLYIRGGTLNMSDSSVTGNLAPGGTADGSGIFGYQSVLNIDESIISGNSMTGSNSEGAGIFSQDSDLTLTNSVVSLNSTSGTQSEGAGLYLNGGTSSIQNSIISLNSTTGLLSTGAGIAVVAGTHLVSQSTLDSNTTSGISASGGGIHNSGGVITVIESTISNNSVSGTSSHGGGVYNATDLLLTDKTSIINSTISGNSGGENGGGVYNASGLTELRHTTVTNNSVPLYGRGGGVASYGTDDARTEVYSTIISGNSLSDVDTVGGLFESSFVSLGFNLIGNGLATDSFIHLDSDFDGDGTVNGTDFLIWQSGLGTGPGATKADGDANGDGFVDFDDLTVWSTDVGLQGDQIGVLDPILGALADNGGPTLTHQPLLGSPAIDAGDPSAVAGVGDVPLTDQRILFSRVLGGIIDIGSYEQDLPVPPAPLAALSAPSADLDVPPPAPVAAQSGSLAALSNTSAVAQVEGVTSLELSFSMLSGQSMGRPSFSKPAYDSDTAARDVSLAQLAGLSRVDMAVSEALAFGDSVTSRSEDEDADEQRDEPFAEDRVFELLGAGLL